MRHEHANKHENASVEAGRASGPAGGQRQPGDPPRILSEKECDAIVARVRAFAKGGGDTDVLIKSWWQGELRWGRNRISLLSDRRDVLIKVSRCLPETHYGYAVTNQVDDVSLEAAVRAAERQARMSGVLKGAGVGTFPPLPQYPPHPLPVWSDATFNATTEDRSKLARALMDVAEAKGMLSAGYMEVRAGSIMSLGTEVPQLRSEKFAYWEKPYQAWTQAQCSLTVRDPEGTGSGWAGHSSYDFAQIDTAKLGELAVEKCLKSRNPVALEPGRYTVILEPAAVASLMEPLVDSFSGRDQIERFPYSPWSLRQNYSKLGLKVVDERITIRHDPNDPRLGILMDGMGDPKPVTWIDRGVLTTLSFDRDQTIGQALGSEPFNFALQVMRQRYTPRSVAGYQMSGGPTSVEEMIRTTQRGLLVTRLYGMTPIAEKSLLSTGYTRDGLWLIENGQITKAVKNFRFADSPLFALNSLDQLGEPVPVFRPTVVTGDRDAYEADAPPETPAIVPPMKVRDFNFTAMIDAV